MPSDYAVVPRRTPGPGKSGTVSPSHVTRTRENVLDAGDPFNARNIVHPGDFYMEGKPWHDPGVHVNFYNNARSTNSIMNRFFGTVSKLRYIRQPTRIARGRQHVALGGDVIVEAPSPVTYGDFATYRAGVIHSGGL